MVACSWRLRGQDQISLETLNTLDSFDEKAYAEIIKLRFCGCEARTRTTS